MYALLQEQNPQICFSARLHEVPWAVAEEIGAVQRKTGRRIRKLRNCHQGFQIPHQGFQIRNQGFQIPNQGFQIPSKGF